MLINLLYAIFFELEIDLNQCLLEDAADCSQCFWLRI